MWVKTEGFVVIQKFFSQHLSNILKDLAIMDKNLLPGFIVS